MNRFLYRKLVTSILFVVILIGGLILNLSSTGIKLMADLRDNQYETVDEQLTALESVINENAYGKYAFLELYGLLQQSMGKEEENDFEVVKDKNGFLHFTYFANESKDLSDLAERMSDLQTNLKNPDTKLMYVMTPDKYMKGYTEFSAGLPYNYANETADDFLAKLSAAGIATFDYRNAIANSKLDLSKLFYKTDHHWTTETAFWAFTELILKLNLQDELNISNLDYYTDLSNYNTITYENSFLGSLGRKTGILYSGLDDFTLIYPKFPTNYVYDIDFGGDVLTTKGRFEQSLLNLQQLNSDTSLYDAHSDRYSTYLYGNQPLSHIQNLNQPDGPKILISKDSFMVPVAAFLSTVCSDVYLVDPRYYEGNITEFINSVEGLDYVMVAFTPQDLTEEFIRFN